MNYYNEHDPKAAHWLRSLIAAGLIPDGHVDERSICDVRPSDLEGYVQCHFFAGIGGWSHALELAAFDRRRSCWTGSCPCQPFSSAGRRRGTADSRHLWPAFRWLIAQCRPVTVFGEQVASSDGLRWFAGVRADLEVMRYAVWGTDLPAACVGAPHKRQRLFWVADAHRERQREARRRVEAFELGGGVAACGMGDTSGSRLEVGISDRRIQRGAGCAHAGQAAELPGDAGGVEHAASHGRQQGWTEPDGRGVAGRCGWSDYRIIPCESGKWRRIESGIEPLVDGLSGRVAFLRGLGNAIVPQVAARFIRAYMDTKGQR